ncbi:hypothetical protein H310_07455 [Aphanomyces invadans]|uniref:Cilia- and flagella-associated protein 206 n=1 Tax=Aphanomyces invadans TaxID=157072 RepID=A0A024U1C6_9STRA|nr:hypothetical protein H310_07455 [Aphanomyces invadans]ETW00015.1 hypothetical protein H310_07455 [Aphanomyces invadans]|eukprot:XP_008871040.1 hypothetical protein H310_07455 [Aphanomyces invadans]
MERIPKLVADVVARCKYEGVAVSDTLAAFICRTVVQDDANRFCLDGDVDADGLAALTHASVTRLLQKDSPSLETIKMQLDFDLCYVKHEEEVEKGRAAKQKKIAALHRSIVLLQPNGTGDFDTLTTLYRQIFTLLMVHADADKTGDRNVEREVAAALESVFPRIGLKSFVSMSADDKKFQLKELASIVGGIRLFNKEIGKGGAGIGLTLDTIRNNVTNVSKLAAEEVEEANVAATEYTEVLLHLHHYNAKDSVTAERLERWQEELNNKRQFLSYLQSLYEDIDVCVDKISRIMATYDNELNTLKALVGARTSLPKGQVYPVFEALSKAWEDLDAEHQLLLARSRSVKALMQFKDSFTRTLSPQSEWILKAKKAGMPSQDHWFDQATELDNQPKFAPPSSSLASGGAKHASGDEGGATGANDDVPVRMSVDSTPEFMQLPLEYQGYCPWTLVRRGGLLLPGDPSLGVIQFRNAYHVFVNERALEEFMVDPAQFVGIVHDMVVRKPELIYLLRLQETFPDTSMASLLRLTNNRTHVHPLLAPHAVQKVDAGTSTPTHFVEKNMDVNYEWNEWSLRRRAVKIANLRNYKTVSAQTTLSTFRKDADQQVWLPTDGTTQTGHDRGTNPTRTITYFAGLRGMPTDKTMPAYLADDASKHDDGGKDDDDDVVRPAIVSYAFDL